MKYNFDLNAILTPISAENPAGEDLRYTPVYDEIKEARRADDPIPQGDWEREVKTADWGKVITVATKALSERTKDLQIAACLAEALTITDGFEGLNAAIAVLAGFNNSFFEEAFPRIEDDDYDYRIAPFEFLNDKLTLSVKQIPLTDPRVSPGYSFLKWQESRDVGYESEGKRPQREERLAEGKIPAEEFDIAVAKSSAQFYKALSESITLCLESYRKFEQDVDEKYGQHAPRLSDLGQVLDECHRMVSKICREQKGLREAMDSPVDEAAPEASMDQVQEQGNSTAMPAAGAVSTPVSFSIPVFANGDSQESQIWNEALRIMQARGFKEALNLLLAAANSQSSERGRNRYRFLVAKLCLKGGRPELARPIVEQLNTMITELQLEKWECPFWISEILEALYQCLMTGDDYDEDAHRAKELFKKICTMDVTKALG